MKFNRDYTTDFDQIVAGLLPDYSGAPYAFARFADGELGLMTGRPHRAKSDHWIFSGGFSPLAEPLRQSLGCVIPGWHVGISCPCHQADDHREFRRLMGNFRLPHLPPDRVTFATIFVGQNYYRFRDLNLDFGRLCVVAHANASGPQFTLPQSGIEPAWLGWDAIVDELLKVGSDGERRPIIVAGGPLSNIIIHQYWLRMADRNFEGAQVIVDIGSAADKILRGRRSRRYQFPEKYEAMQYCRWDLKANDYPMADFSINFPTGQ
jgi:hypothetical protein